MKKILLSILLSLNFIGVEAQSWVYHEFPDSNAVWNVSYQEYGVGSCGEYSYTLSNDTVINGVSFYKINKTGHDFSMTFTSTPFPNWNCDHSIPYATYYSYAGAIREDVLQKKVYYITMGDTTQQLLYDFNLNVGDTLKGYLNLCIGCNIVQSVDSILIGSDFRKSWNIQFNSNPVTYKIIEGIGSEFGLLNPFTDFEYHSNLDCFSQYNESLYPFYSSTSTCPVLNTVDNMYAIQNAVVIYPNPSSGNFQISILNDVINSLTITDVLGKTIYKSEVKNKTTEVNLSDKESGIYFVKMTDEKGNSVTKKIIKE